MDPAEGWPLLIGRDNTRTKLWLIVALGLFFFSSYYWALVTRRNEPEFFTALGWEGLAVLLILFIAIQAYTNDGLVVSWALAFAAVAGTILETLGRGGGALSGSPSPLHLLLLTLIFGLVGAATFGTIGFIVGELIKGISRRVRTWDRVLLTR